MSYILVTDYNRSNRSSVLMNLVGIYKVEITHELSLTGGATPVEFLEAEP